MEPLLAVHPNQFVVHTNRGGASGQAEGAGEAPRRAIADQFGDADRDSSCQCVRLGEDIDPEFFSAAGIRFHLQDSGSEVMREK